MKLETLDLQALEYLSKAIRKSRFQEMTINDAMALSRGVLVLEEVLVHFKKPIEPPVVVEEVLKKKGRAKKDE